MDANENAIGSPLTTWCNRYPDPYHLAVREKISRIKNLPANNIVLGNGSDECIDFLIRIFCEPGKDHIITCPPTFEMYHLYAKLNHAGNRQVPLTKSFQLDLEALELAIDDHSKMIFICSPNSPTGNNLHREDIESIIINFPGIVVVDEAYINYSRNRSFVSEIKDHPNLVVLQTFSKAWGLAGLRVGMAMASEPIIQLFNKIRPPFNISSNSQQMVIQALDHLADVNTMILETIELRDQLIIDLKEVKVVEQVYPSDANFLLVKCKDARAVYEHLKEHGILVSDKSRMKGCENCLRMSIGTASENKELVEILKAYNKA
jgi:histidinol-phosphate aminotransferase